MTEREKSRLRKEGKSQGAREIEEKRERKKKRRVSDSKEDQKGRKGQR